MSPIRSGDVAKRSPSSTTASASFPTSSVPTRSSAKKEYGRVGGARPDRLLDRQGLIGTDDRAGDGAPEDRCVDGVQRPVRGDRGVTRQGEPDTGLDELAVRLEPVGAPGVQCREPCVAGVPEVARLAHGHDAEPGHALDLVRARTAAMLDPVAVVVARLRHEGRPRTRRGPGRSRDRPGRGRRSASPPRARARWLPGTRPRIPSTANR